MSSLPLADARRKLGLSQSCSELELKAAYRAQVRLHPPDREPESFRAVRTAYEALQNPLRVVDEWLLHEAPHVVSAPAEAAPAPPHGHAPVGDGSDLIRAGLAVLLSRQPLDALFPEEELDRVDHKAVGHE